MTNNSEELKLVQRLLSLERQAWNDFVARYQGLVCARIHRTAKEFNFRVAQADLEDITAEVFSSLLTNNLASLRQFRGLSSLGTWLSVIARRTCLRILTQKRHDRAVGTIGDTSDYLGQISDEEDCLLESMVKQEDSMKLNETLNLLNENDRLLLNLYYREEIGYQEIGKRMGISINSVGPKLQRAKTRLRKLLRQV